MTKGAFNKTELGKLARIHSELQSLISKFPDLDKCDSYEESAVQPLIDARNRVAEVLNWQSPSAKK